MKLFEFRITERKKSINGSQVKKRPILIVAGNAAEAKSKVEEYWGPEGYKWSKPNMIFDFNPR